MGTKKWTTWTELKNEALTQERQARIRQEAIDELRLMEIGELRRVASTLQDDLPDLSGFERGEWLHAERGSDQVLTMIRKYVESLGGELEVAAVFGDHRIRLRSFA